MKTLKDHLRDYLELRRGLGFELGRVESRLRNFIAFMGTKRAWQITTALALEFALRSDHRSARDAGRMPVRDTRVCSIHERHRTKTEIPPTGLIRRGHRPQPYIYSDDEIIRILDAARRHRSIHRYALKPHTLYCLFGLLSVTGMRLTEALNLKLEDIDWQQGVLSIGRAKFQKSRLVPLHESTLRQLRDYKKRRDRFFVQQPWRRPVQ